MANNTLLFCGSSELFLKKELTKYSNKSNGGVAFRIPSIVNAGGTLVAAIDRASCGCDWGYIEIAIRRSEDGGKTWSDVEVIAAPPARESQISGDNYSSAFFIDPCMIADDSGKITMFVDFWPECKGIFSRGEVALEKNKRAYSVLNGQMMLQIYDEKKSPYYVADDGTVFDKKGSKTDYTVKDIGYLYKGNEYVGNIFIRGTEPSDVNEMGIKTTFGAPLKAPRRSYIYMLQSTDCGKTWSKPKDITGMILNNKDGVFLGVAPGTGLKTQSGRLVMPLYRIHSGLCNASVYSDDGGENWQRNKKSPYSCNKDEWQVVETENGVLLGLGRQKSFGKTPVSVSYDSGCTWEKEKKTGLCAPRCQKSILLLDDGYILCSHPSSKKRENGVISVGKVIMNGKRYGNIVWDHDLLINSGFFAYSCLVKVDENTIGVMYESQPGSFIEFQTYKVDELLPC